ncbi:gp436 family protein [Pseudoalteromonas ruthenica]|uniref:gp436 family protein n=1 Tax=Pseudoalteromonas ruthenica TaxID=151081 RepID=UPI00241FA5F6|nr:phage protein Gp36 family protein [Pseudoalteromonas ruthenica]|tara:strand:+ start:39044 stop:39472 length:429 start_codon:yes stop_codon:yes gene_type:complete
MAYATVADMLERFDKRDMVILTAREASNPDEVNVSVLEQALSDASAEIDGYLAGRYSMPLASVPTILVSHCCDIARYRLGSDHAPEVVKERYENALKFLRDVGKGVLSLGTSSTGAKPDTGDTAIIHSSGRVFSREKSKGWL